MPPACRPAPRAIDIPLFIRQINAGNARGAARTIYDANWFGHACGKVCPTEVLCEGACVYNHSDVQPIDIGRLQSYATARTMDETDGLYVPGPDTGKRVAVVGAGPAGIAAACELRVLGHAVDVFEARSLPSGLNVYGVAPYKITNDEAVDEMRWLEGQLGYRVTYDHPVDAARVEELIDAYDAVFLGVGLGPTRETGIPGEDLEGVWGAVEFVEQLRTRGHEVNVPGRVVVLGGGNTAMDVASESARMGAHEVTLA